MGERAAANGLSKRWPDAVLAAIALAMIIVAVVALTRATSGLIVETVEIDGTPATIFRPTTGRPAPAVVIAHGFAGSQQLMQSFAITFARNGYVAIIFDFLGHGKNPRTLRGSITKASGATQALVDQLGTIVVYARTAPGADGRIVLLGHSMASDIVVRYAKAHPDVAATIAVSMFAPGLTPTSPRDLLVIVGALEPQILKAQGLEAAAMAAEGPAQPGVTYGSLSEGTARRVAYAASVEHIGVLYSRDSMAEALAWLDGLFGRHGSGYLEVRGPWLCLLFLGLVVLARPVFGLLPQVSARPLGAGLPWRRLLPVAIIPAVLTPLILWKMPTHFLPLLLGDYLAMHFLTYGVLTAIGLWLMRRLSRSVVEQRPVVAKPIPSMRRFGVGVAVVAFYSVIVFGLPIEWFVASFWPIAMRLPLILALMVGTLPYVLADEWLTRGASAPRGSYAFTKLCFLMSLAAAVALNLEKLFFLIIIAVVILLFFIVYGLFSAWAFRATRNPLVGGLSNALAFAWAIAVTFPLLA